MRITKLLASTVLLLAEADTILAKVAIHFPGSLGRRDIGQEMRRSVGNVMRRTPQSASGTLGTSDPLSALNQTIGQACLQALAPLTGVDNEAGLTSCYNILQYDQNSHTFEADLRLYQTFTPTGPFTNISVNDIMIGLTFPTSTMFQSLTKRKRDLEERQSASNSSMLEIQQYTLYGSFQSTLDTTKLNQTQIMSLMLPIIKLNTAEAQKAVSANLTAKDGAWFVVGEFKDAFDPTTVNAAAASDAILIAVPYVLPGTSLGIFPTGLIVTLTWTVIFLLAYGFGTLGRIRYRDAYRKRIAAQMGRTGKRI